MNRSKSLANNAILSALKTLTAIVFPLITYPYITRILLIEDIGKINFSQSIVSYFLLIAAFGIPPFAIRTGAQLKDDIGKLREFANRIFTINCITSTFAGVLLYYVSISTSALSDYRTIIWIQGLAVFLLPIGVEWLYTIFEDFLYITIRSVIIQMVSLLLMFAFVRKKEDVYIYVLIVTISNALGNIYNFYHVKKYIQIKPIKKIAWNTYKSSVSIFFINSLTSTIYLNSDTTLLGLMCNDYFVGLYSVAVKIYSICKQVINAVVASVIPRLSYLWNKDKCEFENLLSQIINLMVMLCIPVTFGTIILRESIIGFLFGVQYAEAATTLGILSLAIFFAVFSNVLANGVLVCMNYERKVVRATILSAIVNVVLNCVCIPLFKHNGAALTTLLAEIIMMSISLLYTKDIVAKVLNVKEYVKCIFAGVIMYIGSSVLSMIVSDRSNMIIIYQVVVCAMLYCTSLYLMRSMTFVQILDFILLKVRRSAP